MCENIVPTFTIDRAAQTKSIKIDLVISGARINSICVAITINFIIIISTVNSISSAAADNTVRACITLQRRCTCPGIFDIIIAIPTLNINSTVAGRMYIVRPATSTYRYKAFAITNYYVITGSPVYVYGDLHTIFNSYRIITIAAIGIDRSNILVYFTAAHGSNLNSRILSSPCNLLNKI